MMNFPKLVSFFKNSKQKLHHQSEQLRDQLATIEALPQLVILGLLTGSIAGLVIVLFRALVEIPLYIALPDNNENFEMLSQTAHFWIPVIGAICLGVVMQLFDKKHYSTGVAHVLDRIRNHQGRLPFGNFFMQLLGGAFCLITGQSVGREGPAVHLGAASGSLLGQWLKLPNNSLKPLAGCGVAAAIAACFNTPMAGVIFAMEVVVMEYSIAGFLPVILSAVAGTAISQAFYGNNINFNPLNREMGGLIELPLFIIAGFSIAIFAAAFIRIQLFVCKYTQAHPIALRIAAAGLVTGCGAVFYPQIMGVGYDTIDLALAGQLGLSLLIGLMLIKLMVTAVVLGLGTPGGVIGPLLFIGACVGGVIGGAANWLMPQSASPIGFYVILGMGAMMGAVLNAPLAAMMAILELTFVPGIIFPSMLVVVVACLTSRWAFKTEGLFEALLKVQGKHRTMEVAEHLLSKTGIRSLLDRRFAICPHVISFQQAENILSKHPNWVILDEEKQLINASDLAAYMTKIKDNTTDINLLEISARRLDMVEVAAESNLYQALVAITQAQVDAVYICQSNQIVGVVTNEKINNYYRL